MKRPMDSLGNAFMVTIVSPLLNMTKLQVFKKSILRFGKSKQDKKNVPCFQPFLNFLKQTARQLSPHTCFLIFFYFIHFIFIVYNQ